VDGSGSGTCPVSGFGISRVESPDSATRVILYDKFAFSITIVSFKKDTVRYVPFCFAHVASKHLERTIKIPYHSSLTTTTQGDLDGTRWRPTFS